MTTKNSKPLDPRPGLLEIKPYVGGESELEGMAKVMKLSSNEGALGPSPRAVEAYKHHAAEMHRYPDGGATKLRAAIAARYGLDAERIVCGAGSDELITLLCRAYVAPGEEILYPRHGFLMYAINAKGVGGSAVTAAEVDLTANVDTMLAAVTPRTRAVFLANPNNPTGSYMPASEVQRLRDNLPEDVLLVIDAAYAEYVGRNDYTPGVELVDATANTVMTRTFSKIHGMGGLRLGWAYCPPAVADVLNRLRNPFNAPSAAQAAGIAAIEDVAFTDLVRAHNDHWLPWTADKIRALGFEVAPSVANFILVHFPDQPGRDVASADDFLRARGIIVRRVSAYGLPKSLRITIGTGDEMQAVIAALTEFVGS